MVRNLEGKEDGNFLIKQPIPWVKQGKIHLARQHLLLAREGCGNNSTYLMQEEQETEQKI